MNGEHNIAGLSQVMSSYPDQEINNIFEEVVENSYERENQGNVTANPYAELIPYFVCPVHREQEFFFLLAP